MASKNISITSDIYHKLKQLQRPKESFSGVIGRLLDQHKNPLEFLGKWKDWDDFSLFEEGISKSKGVDKEKDEILMELMK
ncbi:MAG: antitoxin VapB family protein [Promethearchaeota archaeon]